MMLSCPVYVEADDDICAKPIKVDAWPGEPMTYWYPGSPPGVEVVEAECEHAETIMEKYYDDIMQQLADHGNI